MNDMKMIPRREMNFPFQIIFLISLIFQRWSIIQVVEAATTIISTNTEGRAFLEKNRQDPNVTELPSGLQYKILREGTGIYHPTHKVTVVVQYNATLINGTRFDSTHDRGGPTTFAPFQAVAGMQEALQMMVEKDLWEITVPAELGYKADRTGGKIPPGDVIQFHLELLEIRNARPVELKLALQCNVTTLELCKPREVEYIEKYIRKWDEDKVVAELQRLKKILAQRKFRDGKLEPTIENWMHRRVHMLRQVAPLPPPGSVEDPHILEGQRAFERPKYMGLDARHQMFKIRRNKDLYSDYTGNLPPNYWDESGGHTEL